MATHSSTLALKIPWMEELGAGYYPWGRKESGTTSLSLSLSSLYTYYCNSDELRVVNFSSFNSKDIK